MTSVPVVVVGGGVSGLALAHALSERGIDFLLLEQGSRFGGNIQTERHDGFVYDVGPDSFLRTRPFAESLARRLGLGDELIAPRPEGAQVFVAHEGVLHPMPEGLSLGVPTRLGALLSTSLLSDVGKARALFEPFVSPATAEEESIAAFCARRLGPEMASRVAAPLLSGVFAGSAEELSMNATFPQLVELEKKHGSLFRGMHGGKSIVAALRSPKREHPSPFLSLRRGLASLIERLVERLPKESLRLGTEVLSVQPEGDFVRVRSSEGEFLAQRVVIAGPPWFAAKLLEPLDRGLGATLREIPGAPTATVFFGLREKNLERPLLGSGFIVPPGEGGILAATFTSSKWQERAPAGSVLVRAFVGGARGVGPSPATATERELKEAAFRELTRFLGDLGEPSFSRVFRYPKGTPQPVLGHSRRLKIVRSALASFPGLDWIGPGLGGVGIPDCIRQAEELAERLNSELS